jgi:hypothetical protein
LGATSAPMIMNVSLAQSQGVAKNVSWKIVKIAVIISVHLVSNVVCVWFLQPRNVVELSAIFAKETFSLYVANAVKRCVSRVSKKM